MTTPTKLRGQQVRPTKAEISAAWARLRAAAEQGHIEANALLIALAENKPTFAMEGALARFG
ncbi:hypothetical protein LOY42_04290 [Pseudomonas sp. B21-023]|uniref:hypothetical protein n=1 Tax=Pseudomonas sp. B21-023 TaxID=2895477 RepID=UPI00215EE6E7|nr:hypothetical protein [Pseudomonas sp. B21-023]UVM17537.1 hypothetical protein LOY42_04290 [Pseudomonas sp. B21-023]